MTLAEFRQLHPRAQLLATMTQGIYLAQRWEVHGPVFLYCLPHEAKGFFVEIGYDASTIRMAVQRSFSSIQPLEDYIYGVQLPTL